MICGRRVASILKLVGRRSATHSLLFVRRRWPLHRREPPAHCSASQATTFMKRHTVTGESGGKPGGRQKFKLLKESKLFIVRSLRTVFLRNSFRSDYIYERTASYGISLKKQDKFKSLKTSLLSRCGSFPRREKMLKMQDDPTICMKKQAKLKKRPLFSRVFRPN